MADLVSIEVAAANSCGLDPNVAVAQAIAESAQNPNAVSSAGAEGLYQFLPSTWTGLGCSGSIWDPQASSVCRCSYMTQLLGMFGGDYSAALAAYNWGPGRVKTAINTYGPVNWLSHAPTETQNYVAKILGMASTFNYGSSDTGQTDTPAPSPAPPSDPSLLTLYSCPADQQYDPTSGNCLPIGSDGGSGLSSLGMATGSAGTGFLAALQAPSIGGLPLYVVLGLAALGVYSMT